MNDPIPFQPVDRATGAAQFFSRMQRYRSLLKRRWWILLLSLLVAVGAQTYRASQTPLTYVSKAQMISGNRAVVTDNSASAYTYEENFVGTAIALLKGELITTRAKQVMRERHPDLKPCEVILTADLAPRTSIFMISGRGTEPEYTRAFVNVVMEEFLKYRQEIRADTTQETLRSITTEAGKARVEVETARKQLEDFKTTNSIANVEQEATAAVQNLIGLQAELRTAETELRFLESATNATIVAAAANQTDKANANGAPIVRDHDQAKRQIELLKHERSRFEPFLKDAHPKMVQLNRQIQEQEKLLTVIVQQNEQQLTERRAAVKTRIQALTNAITSEQQKALAASARLAVFDTLKKREQTAESLYNKITSMLDSVRITTGVPVENMSVLQNAAKAQPDNSAFTKNIIIGCFIGIVFGVGLLFLLDRFDDRPVSYTELTEHFDELVIGQIPQDATRGRDRKAIPLTANDPRYAYAEAHRNLRSSLIFMATEGARPRTICVTSAIPGEGKSTVAVNLAITMAFAGSRVLLIDADLRKGTVHEYFDAPEQPGLSDALGGEMTWQAAIQTTNIPNLEIIPRGNYPHNPGELLLAGIDALLKETSQHYDFVLFDSAPVLAADDTASLAPKVDGTLFVIRAAYTSARLARNGLDLLYQRQVNVMGIVFNSVETRSREYYYFKYPEYYSKRLAHR